jgi:hypothetical protein
MRRFLLPACLLTAALAFSASADDKAKGTKVTFDGMTSTTPATWVEETPSNTFRFAQFKPPKVKGDEYDAELVIFKGLGGSKKDNMARWQAQFVAPKGKSAEDISKESEIKIGGHTAHKLVIEGTTTIKRAPNNPREKGERRPDYKMIAVHFEGPKNVYHLKLIGPKKTVDHYAKGFDAWLKGFKE